jgi:hypothetical protein
MPIAKFKLPDGRVAKFDIPYEVSKDESLPATTKPPTQTEPIYKQEKTPISALPMGLQDLYMQTGEGQTPDVPQAGRALSAAARGAVQGATFNFADELIGTLGASGARAYRPDLFKNETFEQTQARAIEIQRIKEDQATQESPAAQMAGEFVGTLAGGAAGLSTKLGKKVVDVVAAAPTKMQAFLRGGVAAAPAGVVQGMGGATGTFGERVPEGITQGATTALTAGALTSGGKLLAETFAPKIKKAIAEIPLTLGQSTQNALVQSFEESALKGAKGEIAQQALSGYRELQENAVRRKLSDISPKTGKDVDIVSDVVTAIKESRSAMDNAVNQAYEAARQSGEAVLSKKLARDVLGNAIKSVQERFVLADSPNAKKLIKDFKKLTKTIKERSLIIGTHTPDTPLDVVGLEKWRSRVTTAANNTKNRQEAKFLSAIRTQYDNFVDDVIEKSLITGDEQTLRLYKKARDLRKDFGKRFESDKIVSKILTDETLTPENVTNMIFGAGTLKGKETSARVIDSLYKAAGNDAIKAQGELKSAIMLRLLDRATSKELSSAGEELLSFAKLDTEINNLIYKNNSLARKIFSPNEIKAFNNISEALKFINSKKPGVVNNSNTFEKLAQNIGTFKRIPIVNVVADSLKDARNATEAARSIMQIKPVVQQSATQSKFLLSGAVAMPENLLRNDTEAQ